MASRVPLPVVSLLPRWCLVALLLGPVVLSGCASSREATPTLPSQFPNHTAAQIHQNITAPTDSLERFRAEARLTLRSPQRNGTFNADLRQVRAGSLYMSLSLFGIEGARVLITPDSAFFYDRRNNQMMVGTVDEAQAMLPMPLTSEIMFDNMLGLVAPPPSAGWTVDADSSLYFLTDPSGRRTYTIDPMRWRVVRYAEKTPDGDPLEERLFSNFEQVDGVSIPQQIIFRRPQEDLIAILRYRSLNLSPSSLSFSIGAGDEVRRVGMPTL